MKHKWIVVMLATIVFVFVGLNVTSVYADSLPVKPPVVNGVVEVSTPTQLSYINLDFFNEYKSSTIKLMNNLDMTGYTWWQPILNFSGVFDGNGYDISNLTISQSAQDEYGNTLMGVFASTTSSAIIKNLTLSNCIVTGNVEFMGALTGINRGNISNVGIIGGSVHQTGIFDSYSYYAGGIAGGAAGNNFLYKSISDSYSTSDVTGVDNYAVSGLTAAYNDFNIVRSYVAGSLTGGYEKFGIAHNDGTNNGHTTSLYFNKDKTGTVLDPFFQRSTQDMLQQSNFVGWDFQNTWYIIPGQTYPFLKGMRSVTPSILPPAFENSVYSQKLQIPSTPSTPSDLTWHAISIPPGLSLANDGTLTGTPTSIGDQSVTVAVYSPSTHIVYGSGTISLLINPDPKSNAPTVNNMDIVNNLAPTADTVTVSQLNAGDVIKVYDSAAGGNLLGQSPPVANGLTSELVSIAQLGTAAGQVYVSITSTGKTESTLTVKPYEAEPIIDTIAPVTKYHFDPIYGQTSSGRQYIKGYMTTLRATDNVSGSGVKNVQYRINGGTWITYTAPFTFYAGITHTVEYFSTDNAGNVENPINLMDFDKGKFTGAGKF
jgi:hypothetical protein